MLQLRPWARLGGAIAVTGFAASVGAAVGAAWQQAHTPTPVVLREALPAGEYHDGDPLPATHPLAQPASASGAPLDLRGACVWGRPGRNPFRGSVDEALRSAQVPAAVRSALVAKAALHQRDGRLLIANDAIHETSSQRVFASRDFAMTYGRTLCLETRVNFPAGHTEAADLYEVQDAGGRRYAMMLPDVCGNVSLIAEFVPGDDPASRRLVGGGLPSQLRLGASPGSSDEGRPHTVPAPGTLALVLAGLAGWAATPRRRP